MPVSQSHQGCIRASAKHNLAQIPAVFETFSFFLMGHFLVKGLCIFLIAICCREFWERIAEAEAPTPNTEGLGRTSENTPTRAPIVDTGHGSVSPLRGGLNLSGNNKN